MKNNLMDMYLMMRQHFGHLGWWPAQSPFEVIVGAILTQNTSWANVEKAILNLKNAGKMTPRGLMGLNQPRLAELIRPAGYYNLKAQRLQNFMDFFRAKYGLSIKRLKNSRMPRLRSELLNVNGIGPETADSILLYALGKRTFVVDAYTKRILSRHGVFSGSADYHELKAFFEKHLPPRVGLYKDFHAQIVYTAKTFCRKLPKCSECPLSDKCQKSIKSQIKSLQNQQFSL